MDRCVTPSLNWRSMGSEHSVLVFMVFIHVKLSTASSLIKVHIHRSEAQLTLQNRSTAAAHSEHNKPQIYDPLTDAVDSHDTPDPSNQSWR